MKLTDIYRMCCLFIFFGSIVLSTLMLQANIAKAPNGYGITPSEAQADSSMISPGKGEKKEGDMTVIDKLTDEEGKYLLYVARKTIEQRLFDRKKKKEPDANLPAIFNEPRGTFVTLTIKGGLRGCIGHIIPQETLLEGIRVNAINAAFRDPRFRPLSREEWKNVKIEISILTDPKQLSYSDAGDLLKKLRPDVDGVIIKKGYHQSTFLPQVWEQLPKKEDFLTHLCLKAGLGGDAWNKGDLDVSTYQVQAFEE
jgi:AmmeMemoRadiSam system protein A